MYSGVEPQQAPTTLAPISTICCISNTKSSTLKLGCSFLMTKTGTFIINGAERVIVSQLVRSPGAYFTTETDPTTGRELCLAKLIPYRGAWIELETNSKDIISIKVDRKRKANITTFLRALGWDTNAAILSLFKNVDSGRSHKTELANRVRKVASSTAESPPPTTAMSLPGVKPAFSMASRRVSP